MKKNFLKIFTTITVAAILAVGVSYVSAQSTNSQPTQPAPVVNAPIHTGTVTQSKMGDVLSQKLLVAPIGLFKKSIFLPGKNAALRIGSSDTATGTQSFNTGTAGATATQLNTMIFNGTHTEPVVLDLVKRSSGPAIRYINTGGQCTVATRLVNDRSSAFQFNKGTSSANIIARQVQLTAGNPGKDKVLVGDASGNARWATATVENGVVKFSSGTSPVIAGLQCGTTPPPTCPAGTTGTPPNCVAAPIDRCNNIDGVQTTLPNDNLIEMPNGSCQCDVGNLSPDGVCIISGGGSGTGGGGCFIENTKVTMSDGSSKNIQDITVGDKVKGIDRDNTVISLIRPQLGSQAVYSINGSRDFFTANHPFLTTKGWKSLDPKTTKKEIPELSVSLMKLGDTLITESGKVVIRSIEKSTKPANTQLYNFELDGDRTYYADGYAVHNKEELPDTSVSCTNDNQCNSVPLTYCHKPGSTGTCVTSKACSSNNDCRNVTILGTTFTQGTCVPWTGVGTGGGNNGLCRFD